MRQESAGHLARRIFLDTGVIIQGCFTPWGSAKAVLILLAQRDRYTVVLAEAVEQEVQNAIFEREKRRSRDPFGPEGAEARETVHGWLRRVRIERWPVPTMNTVQEYASQILPTIKHRNDLAAVVTAIQAEPDWVISSNQVHWNQQLAERTGLRIVSPAEFLDHLWIRDV